MNIEKLNSVLGKYGMQVPENYKLEPVVACDNAQFLIDRYASDTKGGGAKFQECVLRYLITGTLETMHPLGQADIVVGSGVTCEVKTGHGWALEPCFDSLPALCEWLEGRKNPMVKASHVAYIPNRATFDKMQAFDALFFTARQFIKILSSFEKLEVKENRGLWGIAIKPWIAEGYAQKSSPKNDAKIREALIDSGMIIEEFCEKFGKTLHDIDKI
jgi:hypothetical protein